MTYQRGRAREGGRERECESERPATVSGNQKETLRMFACVVFRDISVYYCVDRYILVQRSWGLSLTTVVSVLVTVL